MLIPLKAIINKNFNAVVLSLMKLEVLLVKQRKMYFFLTWLIILEDTAYECDKKINLSCPCETETTVC